MANSAQGTTMTFAYDAWGRTTSKTLGAKTAEYAYRYGARLHAVTSDFFDEGNVTFRKMGTVPSESRHRRGETGLSPFFRIRRRRSAAAGGVTMRYRWDAGWNMINEEDGNGTLTRTYWHHPHAGGRAALAHADGANPAQGAWGYYLHDHLGSTRRIHNHTKERIARFDYTPYGELFHAENPGVSTRRFTGHDWSAPASLYFAPYRWYNPRTARWLTRDPLGMVDGPNVFSYVGSNPINQMDSLGLFCTPVFRHKRYTSAWTPIPGTVSYTVLFFELINWARWQKRQREERTYVIQIEWYCRKKDKCGNVTTYWKTTYSDPRKESRLNTVAELMVGASGDHSGWCSVNPWTGVLYCK